MALPEYREGTAFLQFVPDRGMFGMKLSRATQRRPTVLDPDAVIVKVRLRIPRAAFEPLQPEAVVTVPAELVQHPVAVEAVAGDATAE